MPANTLWLWLYLVCRNSTHLLNSYIVSFPIFYLIPAPINPRLYTKIGNTLISSPLNMWLGFLAEKMRGTSQPLMSDGNILLQKFQKLNRTESKENTYTSWREVQKTSTLFIIIFSQHEVQVKQIILHWTFEQVKYSNSMELNTILFGS